MSRTGDCVRNGESSNSNVDGAEATNHHGFVEGARSPTQELFSWPIFGGTDYFSHCASAWNTMKMSEGQRAVSSSHQQQLQKHEDGVFCNNSSMGESSNSCPVNISSYGSSSGSYLDSGTPAPFISLFKRCCALHDGHGGSCLPEEQKLMTPQVNFTTTPLNLQRKSQSCGFLTPASPGKTDPATNSICCFGIKREFSELKTWEGQLPSSSCKNPVYSRKVFLGGVPWDIQVCDLQSAFSRFGDIHVEFPKTAKLVTHVYVVFEDENQVKAMLTECSRGCFADKNEYYFKVSTRKVKNKLVQVIPWLLGDSNHVVNMHHPPKRSDETTIFVGGLHGMLNAAGLALIMDELFDNVCYAKIDSDVYKYPTGFGRVEFTSRTSYVKSIQAGFVQIKTDKFVKKVEIQPFLVDTLCKCCNNDIGPYFCRNLMCLSYFCRFCWIHHRTKLDASTGVHEPVCRNHKSLS